MKPVILLSLAALTLSAAPAMAAAPHQTQAQQKQASIPFAGSTGIWDWRAHGDSIVYLEGAHNQWYRATLFAPATDLPFVNYIGIDARPTGTLDKFGAIYVHGRRYQLSSLVKVDGPPPTKNQLQ